MKISKQVRNKYQVLCPNSTSKCNSFAEIDYKIQRAANIGMKTISSDGTLVGYHNLAFLIEDNVITDMWKLNESEGYIYISNRNKVKYDVIHMKMVV